MTTIVIAEYRPNLPISWAIVYNFIWRGVAETYSWARRALILPIHEESPTTRISSFPSPESTLVPPIIIGEGTSCLSPGFFYPFFSSSYFFLIQFSNVFLWMGSISPVIALSSVVISLAWSKIPSAGIYIPSFIWTISPTKTKSWCISTNYPFRMTDTRFRSSITEFSFINCRYFW